MPLFNEQNPDSQFMIDPNYLPDDKKFLASILGFKQTGERNTLGKIERFAGIQGGVGTNLAARGLFKNSGADDFLSNVKEGTQGDIAGGMAILGAGEAVAGAFTGQPELIAGGVKTAIGSVPQALNTQVNLSDDWGLSIHSMKKGGEMKNFWDEGEDIAMIDKQSGKPVGEISYGERVMDKAANERMKELVAKGDFLALGKFVAKEMGTHSDGEDLKMKKGGVLTAAKAKLILADGYIRGKKITDKQRRYFGHIANGGSDDDYIHSIDVKSYATGDPVIKPSISVPAGDPRLQRYNDSMFAFDRSNQLRRMIERNPATLNTGMVDQFGNYVQQSSPKDIFQRLGAVEPIRYEDIPIPDSTDFLHFPYYKRPEQPYVKSFAGGGELDLKGILDAVGGPEQLFNAGQFITGMIGTQGQLPQFQKPDAWTQYLAQLRQQSQQGFSNAESGAFHNMADRGLTKGIDAAREISGGNSAFAVGDASRFAGDYMDNALKFASANAEMKRNSTADYGNALLQDIGFDKDAFNLNYEQKLREKTGAGELAKTGLQNITDQIDYNRNYGPKSLNAELMKSYIDMTQKLTGQDYSHIWDQFLPNSVPPPPVTAIAPTANPVTPALPPWMTGNELSLNGQSDWWNQ